MNISGKKVLLRAIEEQDNEMLNEMVNDSQIEKCIGGWSFPVSSYAQHEWFKKQCNSTNSLRCIVETKAEKQAIGMISLTGIDYKNGCASLNIKLSSKSRGQGHGSDALFAMCEYAFSELRLNCLASEILEHNIPSQKLFLKVGFKKEGTLRQRVYKQGKYLDVFTLSILKDEFYG